VDQHQTEIEEVNRQLASRPRGEGKDFGEFVLHSVAQIIQINERLQSRLCAAEEKLREQAEHIESRIAEARSDPLTGLPNRRAFDDELARRIAEWQRRQATFCLIMADVDRFKQLNDEHGHPAGDQVLQGMAEVLNGAVRDMDMPARIGGEEFAVILPHTNFRHASRATERIRLAVASRPFLLEGTQRHVTVSLGLAEVRPGDDAAAILKRADEALYAAKRGGRNCAYSHDGRQCRRIVPGAVPSAASEAAASLDVLEAAELAAICDDLRHRLAELTERP
jgi:diguanylate cyclase